MCVYGFMFQINAEFKCVTTMPLQSRFLSQIDLCKSAQGVWEAFGAAGQKAQRHGCHDDGKNFITYYKLHKYCIRSEDWQCSICCNSSGWYRCWQRGHHKSRLHFLNTDPEDLVQEYMVSVHCGCCLFFATFEKISLLKHVSKEKIVQMRLSFKN